MKNFRDYETLIRETVKKVSDADPNWNFSVRAIAKDRVKIRWTYLDYLGEKDNCFMITLKDAGSEFDECFITSRTPQDEMIDGHICSETLKRSWQESYERGIKAAIYDIVDFAHSRY